jgi:hypothetical protein
MVEVSDKECVPGAVQGEMYERCVRYTSDEVLKKQPIVSKHSKPGDTVNLWSTPGAALGNPCPSLCNHFATKKRADHIRLTATFSRRGARAIPMRVLHQTIPREQPCAPCYDLTMKGDWGQDKKFTLIDMAGRKMSVA